MNESTKSNLDKRKTMKDTMYESYLQVRAIRESIGKRINNDDVRDYLELVIKNNFFQS